MVTNIKTREEIALAKIAGYDVDYSTVTPSVPTGTKEKLLDEIATLVSGAASITNATATTAGLVKKAANVAEAEGSAPTAAEFKALIDALIAAGIMEAPASNG